jgi:(p)ppGpp synthase/HD superfamily hydrolase
MDTVDIGAEDRLIRLTAGLSNGDAAVVRAAHRLAEEAHRGQRRKHGTPYIEHPLAVAEILRELGVDAGDVLAAALLHDTLEDTTVTDRDLATFPVRTREIVRLVTDPRPRMSSQERRVHYRDIWRDSDATLVKAADRLSNLGDAPLQPCPEFCAQYAERTRHEMLGPESPLPGHPVVGPLLRAAVERCDAVAAAGGGPP